MTIYFRFQKPFVQQITISKTDVMTDDTNKVNK